MDPRNWLLSMEPQELAGMLPCPPESLIVHVKPKRDVLWASAWLTLRKNSLEAPCHKAFGPMDNSSAEHSTVLKSGLWARLRGLQPASSLVSWDKLHSALCLSFLTSEVKV